MLNVTPTAQPGTPGLQCVTGTVNLFRFIVAPQRGTVIGQLTPLFGTPIPLVQTSPTPLGGIPLSAADGQIATVCGRLITVGNQVVLDVTLVNPGAPSPTGIPLPANLSLPQQLALLNLLRGFPGGAI